MSRIAVSYETVRKGVKARLESIRLQLIWGNWLMFAIVLWLLLMNSSLADVLRTTASTLTPTPNCPRSNNLSSITASEPEWVSNHELVFVSQANPDANHQVYLIADDGSGLRRITNDERDYISAIPSPNGQYLALVNLIQFYTEAYHPPVTDLYVIDRDGSHFTGLTSHDIGSEFRAPAWSPDGRQIAFISENVSGIRYPVIFNPSLYLVQSDGSSLRQIMRAEEFQGLSSVLWSPDGKQIGFIKSEIGKRSEVYTVRPDGSHLRQITYSEGGIGPSFAWSPDSKRIAFVSYSHESDLYLVNATGTGLHRLAQISPEFLRWSADSMFLTFDLRLDGTSGVYSIKLVGNALNLLFHDPCGSAWDPVWSPDSKQIAFESNLEGMLSVYVMNADGGNLHRIAFPFEKRLVTAQAQVGMGKKRP